MYHWIFDYLKYLKWYYDQKIIFFFSPDFESVFASHPTGKILSFAFYPKAVYFECKFCFLTVRHYSRSKLTDRASEGWI